MDILEDRSAVGWDAEEGFAVVVAVGSLEVGWELCFVEMEIAMDVFEINVEVENETIFQNEN